MVAYHQQNNTKMENKEQYSAWNFRRKQSVPILAISRHTQKFFRKILPQYSEFFSIIAVTYLPIRHTIQLFFGVM